MPSVSPAATAPRQSFAALRNPFSNVYRTKIGGEKVRFSFGATSFQGRIVRMLRSFTAKGRAANRQQDADMVRDFFNQVKDYGQPGGRALKFVYGSTESHTVARLTPHKVREVAQELKDSVSSSYVKMLRNPPPPRRFSTDSLPPKGGETPYGAFSREEATLAKPVTESNIPSAPRVQTPPSAAPRTQTPPPSADAHAPQGEYSREEYEKGDVKQKLLNYAHRLLESPDTMPEDLRSMLGARLESTPPSRRWIPVFQALQLKHVPHLRGKVKLGVVQSEAARPSRAQSSKAGELLDIGDARRGEVVSKMRQLAPVAYNHSLFYVHNGDLLPQHMLDAIGRPPRHDTIYTYLLNRYTDAALEKNPQRQREMWSSIGRDRIAIYRGAQQLGRAPLPPPRPTETPSVSSGKEPAEPVAYLSLREVQTAAPSPVSTQAADAPPPQVEETPVPTAPPAREILENSEIPLLRQGVEGAMRGNTPVNEVWSGKATPGTPAGGAYYHERQELSAASGTCGMHALNAFFGGPLVDKELFIDERRNRLTAMLGGAIEPQLLDEMTNLANGADPAELQGISERLVREGRADGRFADLRLETVDAPAGTEAENKLRDFPGDRIVVGYTGRAHFVALRRNATGAWTLVDSLHSRQREVNLVDFLKQEKSLYLLHTRPDYPLGRAM